MVNKNSGRRKVTEYQKKKGGCGNQPITIISFHYQKKKDKFTQQQEEG
jgi:hypothetical protein